MTYLQLINKVLDRLRQDRITAGQVDSNPFLRTIGAHVNDALRLVEGAWSWTGFRQTDIVGLVAGTKVVEIPDSGNTTDYEIRGMFVGRTSDTPPRVLRAVRKVSYGQMISNYSAGEMANGQPNEFAIKGRSSSGNIQIELFPPPAADYTLEISCVRKAGELVSATDTISVPPFPVYTMATALAVEERGEVGGASMPGMMSKAEAALNDAISYDAALVQGELDWTAGQIPENSNVRDY